jgi:hypothetical protein
MVKHPWANGILEWVHQVLGQMLRTAEIDMANSVTLDDVDVFLDNTAWAIHSAYHMVLKASPGAAIFGWDMLFDIPFVADWRNLENTGNHWLIVAISARRLNILTMITRSEIKD